MTLNNSSLALGQYAAYQMAAGVCFSTLSKKGAHGPDEIWHKFELIAKILSCQPRVTVTPCFVYKVIRDLEWIDHLCINPIHRIGLIHK